MKLAISLASALAALPSASAHQDDVPTGENKFIPPSPGSVRGPCPAFNILANHGYIHRSGKNIDTEDLAEMLEEVFGVKMETARLTILGQIARGLEVKAVDGKTFLDLSALLNYEDSIDLDGSSYRPDRPDAQEFSQDLFDEMVGSYCRGQDLDSETCTLQDIADFAVARIEDSCDKDDDAFMPSASFSSFGFTKTTNILFQVISLQSFPPEYVNVTLLDTVPIDELESLIVHGRLPDDFVTRKNRGFDPYDGTEAENIGAVWTIYSQLCGKICDLSLGGCSNLPVCPNVPCSS